MPQRYRSSVRPISALSETEFIGRRCNFRFTPDSGHNSDIDPCPKSANSCRSTSSLLEKIAGYNKLLNFTGTIEDSKCPGMSKQPLHRGASSDA
jgi:hypothetical protein